MNITQLIDSYKEQMLSDLAELVAVPSVSAEPDGDAPFGNECRRALDKFLSIAQKLGFDTVNYDNYAGSAQLGSGKPELGILGHLDVVPVTADDWATPPFTMTIKDGKAFGRGTIDDKGPTVAALYAMKAVQDAGLLNKPVRLIVGCSEETGSELDIEHYMKCAEMPPMVFTPDAEFPLVNGEKGMIRGEFTQALADDILVSLNAGTVVNAVPSKATAVVKNIDMAKLPQIPQLTAEKEGSTVKLTCTGRAAHASTPADGENALTMLIGVLAELGAEPMKQLADIFKHGECTFTTANGGALTYVFSVAEYDGKTFTGKFDIRYPFGSTKEHIFGRITPVFEKLGYKISFPTANNPHYVDENSRFVQTLLKAYHEETGLEAACQTCGGGTYVHEIDGGVAFGPEFPGENSNLHSSDEFISIDNFLKCAKIYARAIAELCG